jgi:hypothetical protein
MHPKTSELRALVAGKPTNAMGMTRCTSCRGIPPNKESIISKAKAGS